MNDTSPPTDGSYKSIDASAWLAAIVENTHDAILSKTLDGIIMTWNEGATKLFGFTADEAIGKSITIVIPEDRLHEEDSILARLRAGERIENFETVRRRKSGELIEISLTVSPVRNPAGKILGASKIARDITAQKRAQERQELLLGEMHHRIKNLFTLATGLVNLSARRAETVEDMAQAITVRLMALSRAHELTLPTLTRGTGRKEISLLELLQVIIAPHDDQAGSSRISLEGEDVALGGSVLTSIALILHELATNAAKYGALADEHGRLTIAVRHEVDAAVIEWNEVRSRALPTEPSHQGFGSALEKAALSAIGATLERQWGSECLEITLRIPEAPVPI